MSTHLGFKIVVMNVPRLLINEIVFGDELSENGPGWLMHPGQKNVLLMSVVVHKFSKPSQLMLHPITGNPSTAKGHLLLEKHRTFVGYDEEVFGLLKFCKAL